VLRDLDALSDAEVRTAYEQAVQWFVATVASMPDDRWDGRATEVWTVRELVAHASRALSLLTAHLDPPPRRVSFVGRTGDTKALLARPTPTRRRDATERARDMLRDLGPDLVGAVWRLGDDTLNRLATTPDHAVCTTPLGTVTLVDHLPGRVGELVVHTLDLRRALGDGAPEPPALPVEVTLAFVLALADPVPAILALTGRIGYDVFA